MPTNAPSTPTGVATAGPGTVDKSAEESGKDGGKEMPPGIEVESKDKAEKGGWSLWWGGGGGSGKSGKAKQGDKVPEAVYLDDLKDNEQMMKKFIGSHM